MHNLEGVITGHLCHIITFSLADRQTKYPAADR